MEWYYSQQNQPTGPVSADQFEELMRSGAITAQTLVWREGLANWMPYSAIPREGQASLGTPDAGNPAGAMATGNGGFAGAAASGGDTVVCVECSRRYPKSETFQFDGASVCTGCKPVFLQKLREGIPAGSASAIWRSGRQLVTSIDATLPARCVKCNAPADGKPIKRKLYWHPPAVYLALLINVIIYVIVAVIARKRGVAMVSICEPHRSARRNVILISWLLVVGGLAMGIFGIARESGWIGGIGGVAFLGGLIYGLVRGRLVVARKIDKEHMWLGGCGAEFLSGFPEWNGPI